MKVGEQMNRKFFELFKENKSYPLRGRCRAVKRAYSRHPYALPRTNLNGTNCVLEEREKERMSSDYNIIGIILKILTK
jgi:hypothetical protein